MSLEIKEPDWAGAGWFCHRGAEYLKYWFRENVEPVNKLLREGTEARKYIDPAEGDVWFSNKDAFGPNDREKALLIDIQPIQKDTAEDVLRDFVNAREIKGANKQWSTWETGELLELAQRAKAVLEESEGQG